jgi:hypothetical protein
MVLMSSSKTPGQDEAEDPVLNGAPDGHRDCAQWPDPAKPSGAVFYAVVGGLIVWLLVDIVPHIHVAITWR